MPLVTLTVTKTQYSPEAQRAILDGVHHALVKSGVPEADRFQRVLELEPSHFIYDSTYPSLTTPRSEKFVLIEILLSVGRSVKVKKSILKTIIENLQRSPNIQPNDVMIVFKETLWENWAFAGGEQIHI
jgi:phenylpyruvate tautomerase PptA (4-oxalocrotonate tautomerase family)